MSRKIHRRASVVAMFEPLEARALLSTFTVTNTNDTGAGSLRQAILDANKTTAVDVIKFAIGSGAKTILPKTNLPGISQPAIIDGTTQPGFAGKPLIELSGASGPTNGDGLKLTGSGITIKGLAINRFGGSGIFIYTKGSNKIIGNYIGTDRNGTTALPNKAHGIIVQSPNNKIGGTTTAERNIISGNARAGIFFYLVAGSNNVVSGNYIGTDATGNKSIPNNNGVQINGSQFNTIGGTAAGARNIISGNTHDGVLMVTGGSNNNVVLGNYIGTNAAGTGRLGNGWYGVEISQPNNIVGGTTAAARNVISANLKDGVVLFLASATGNRIEGNYIGTDYTGTKDLGNLGAAAVATNGAHHNAFGGSTTASRNIIAGNDLFGVGIYNDSDYNTIQNNYIGISATGLALPNTKHGIVINNSSNNTAIKNNNIASTTYAPIQISSGGTTNTQSGNSLYAKTTIGMRVI